MDIAMKKTLVILIGLVLLLSAPAWAADSMTITRNTIVPKFVEQIIFTIKGAAPADTAFTQQDLRYVQGMYLYCVTAYPVSGGTAPDAADVFVLTPNNEDLLGSTDNTTAANGANLIHATLQKSTIPKLGSTGSYFYPMVHEVLTVSIANQETANADYVVVLTFVK